MSACTYAAEKADTTIHFGSNTIKLHTQGDELEVNVENQNGEKLYNTYSLKQTNDKREETWNVKESFNFQFLNFKNEKHNHKRPFNAHNNNFYVGFCGLVDSDLEINNARSHQIGFEVISESCRFGRHTGMFVSLGFNWRNIILDDNTWLQHRGKTTYVEALPADTELTFSRLRTFSFRLPMMFEFQMNGFHSAFIQVGAVGEITPMVRLKNKYNVGKERNTEHIKGLHHNVFGAALRAAVGFNCFGFFAEYSPLSLFTSKQGPDFRPLTFGLGIYF